MNNINFSNPWLLLVGLGLLIVIFVAFFLLVKKDGFNFHNIASLVIHAVIVVMLTIAFSGMTLELNITETDVYVLADCSYSSKRNLSVIDDKIKDLSNNLPHNSKLAVISYGKDYEVVTNLGDKFSTVQNTTVDDTETNVKVALEYTTKQFNDGVIKRIVIITDGLETSEESLSGLISNYESADIHIDAIFLDNTLKDDAFEYQVSSVKYNETTYLNRSEDAVVTIESNQEVDNAIITLENNDGILETLKETLHKGTNTYTFELPTNVRGHKSYKVSVSDSNEEDCDFNPHNNSYSFTQEVSEKIKVLFISNDTDNGENELKNFKSVYSSSTYEITSYVNDDANIPYLLDDLCNYDEIVLDSFNISADDFKDNASSFVTNLNLAVTEYGKSLHTFGNTSVQNSTGEDELKTLGDMLPVSYKATSETKSYTILLDISNSMLTISHLSIAKQAAIKLLNLLNESDYFTVIAFYGNNQIVAQGLASASNIAKATETINNLSGKQATNIQAALEYAYELMNTSNYQYKKVMLISDSLDYSNGSQDTEAKLKEFISNARDLNIDTDMICINENYDASGATSDAKFAVANAIKSSGGYVAKIVTEEEVNGAKFGEITEREIEVYKKNSNGFTVKTNNKNSEVLNGIEVNQKVNEFYASSSKSSANTIISVKDKNKTYPLYATWNLGEGVVTSFTSTFTAYSTGDAKNFISNIVPTYTASNPNYSPYIMEALYQGSSILVTLKAQNVSSSVNITLDVKKDNEKLGTYKFSSNTSNYFTSFDINGVGTYKLTMNFNNVSITKYYTIPYYSEYNSFETSDSSYLYSLVTSDGKVVEDGSLVINNDNLNVIKYKYTFAPLMMILSVILFVVDVAIRKLKLQDIKSLFKKGKQVK